MKPVKFYVVPRSDIEDVIQDEPLPGDYLAEYERERPDVLGDRTQDVFSPNSRSARQRWKDFTLFRRVTNPDKADVVVCQNWLEMLHACDCHTSFRLVIHHVLHNYPDKIVAFSWNHDADSAKIGPFKSLPWDRTLILDYNTSKPWPGSIVLPFWNVSTGVEPGADPIEGRDMIASFVGYIGSVRLRVALKNAMFSKLGYYVSDDRMDEPEYLSVMSRSCYAFCPRGGGLNSYRFYEAIQCGAVPILFADDAVLPFADEIDYSLFSVRIPEKLAGGFADLNEIIMGSNERWDAMVNQLAAVRERFSLLGVQQEVHRRIRELIK